MNDWLRLVAYVLIATFYIVTKFEDNFIKRYDEYPGVYMARDAKYKVIENSK